MRVSRVCVAACAMGLVAGLAHAQQGVQPPRERAAAPRAEAGRLSGQDLPMALCLAIENYKEIKAAQLAESKSQSPEVKQYAQKVLRDHGQQLSKLEQLTGGAAQAVVRKIETGAAAAERTGAERADDAQSRPNDRPVADRTAPATPREAGRRAAGQPIDFIALKAEITAECLKSIKSELADKSAQEFDECYLNRQVMSNMALIDALTVFDRHASPQFKPFLADAKTAAKAHLSEAKQLLAAVDGGQTRPATATRDATSR